MSCSYAWASLSTHHTVATANRAGLCGKFDGEDVVTPPGATTQTDAIAAVAGAMEDEQAECVIESRVSRGVPEKFGRGSPP